MQTRYKGCDYHPSFQQMALVDTETGECGERRPAHREEAEQFYREVKARSLSVRVGMESSGHGRWFERLLRDLQFELWIGDVGDDDGPSRFGVLTATCAPAIARPDLSLTLPEIVPPATSWRLLRFCRAHSPCRRSSTARSYRNTNAGLVGPADSCPSPCGETTRF